MNLAKKFLFAFGLGTACFWFIVLLTSCGTSVKEIPEGSDHASCVKIHADTPIAETDACRCTWRLSGETVRPKIDYEACSIDVVVEDNGEN